MAGDRGMGVGLEAPAQHEKEADEWLGRRSAGSCIAGKYGLWAGGRALARTW